MYFYRINDCGYYVYSIAKLKYDRCVSGVGMRRETR